MELPVEEILEGDLVVSFSELSAYRSCPLKHRLGYVDRWTRPPREGGALERGSLWHAVMETHYRVIQEAQQRLGLVEAEKARDAILVEAWKATRPLLFSDSGSQSGAQSLVEWMYDGHVEQYGTDADWEILGVEHRIALPLTPPGGASMVVPQSPRLVLKARLDLVVRSRSTGLVWVVDHKSGANLPDDKALELDDQFGLYVWLLRESGVPVVGAIYSAARTKRNLGDFPNAKPTQKPQTLQQRFRRVWMGRTAEELDAVAYDAWATAVNARQADLFGGVQLPLYSSPDPRSCGFMCDFKEAHVMARQGRDLSEVLLEQGFEQDWTRH